MKEKILKQEVVFEDYFTIEKWTYQFEKEDGSLTEPVERMRFSRIDSAAVLIFNTDTQKAILVKQFRHCAYKDGHDGWLTEIVAGRLDEGEDSEDAIKREMIEEAGYKANILKKITHVFASPGCLSECMHIYYAEVSNEDKVSEGGGLVEENEFLELVEYTIEDLATAMKNHQLPDAKTVIAVNYFLKEKGY